MEALAELKSKYKKVARKAKVKATHISQHTRAQVSAHTVKVLMEEKNSMETEREEVTELVGELKENYRREASSFLCAECVMNRSCDLSQGVQCCSKAMAKNQEIEVIQAQLEQAMESNVALREEAIVLQDKLQEVSTTRHADAPSPDADAAGWQM